MGIAQHVRSMAREAAKDELEALGWPVGVEERDGVLTLEVRGRTVWWPRVIVR